MFYNSAFGSRHTYFSLSDAISTDPGPAPASGQPLWHPTVDRSQREQPKHATALSSLQPNVPHGDQRAVPQSLNSFAGPREDLAAFCDMYSDLWEELVADDLLYCSEAGSDSSSAEDAQLCELVRSLEREISLQPAEQQSATSSPSQRSFLDCSSWIPCEDEWTDESMSDTSGFHLLDLEAD